MRRVEICVKLSYLLVSMKKKEKFEDIKSDNQKPWIEDGQTIQLPRLKGQNDNPWSTKHYTENKKLNYRNPTKNGDVLSCYGRVNSSCSTSSTICITYWKEQSLNLHKVKILIYLIPVTEGIFNTWNSKTK